MHVLHLLDELLRRYYLVGARDYLRATLLLQVADAHYFVVTQPAYDEQEHFRVGRRLIVFLFALGPGSFSIVVEDLGVPTSAMPLITFSSRSLFTFVRELIIVECSFQHLSEQLTHHRLALNYIVLSLGVLLRVNIEFIFRHERCSAGKFLAIGDLLVDEAHVVEDISVVRFLDRL